ncbi:MAG: fluoride efflux transporter CrcB [Actinomycetota bacterium]|nr:fluoride efflux transporter CrcB [Actinomycetota bacterium]
MTALWVVLGAVVGAPLRFLSSKWLDRVTSPLWLDLPWGTLTVNGVGSLVLGWTMSAQPDPWVAALIGSGFCGALTTYSTFSYETWQLIEARALGRAVLNVAANLMLGFAAAALGWAIGS